MMRSIATVKPAARAVLVLLAAACGSGSPSSAPSTSGDTDTGSSTVGSASVGDTAADSTGESTVDAPNTGSESSTTGVALPGEDELPLAVALRLCAIAEACSCPNYDPAKCVAQLETRVADWQTQAIEARYVFDPACWAQAVELLDTQECDVTQQIECTIYHSDAQRGEQCERFGPWMHECAPPLSCPYQGASCQAPGGEVDYLDEGDPCFDREARVFLGFCDPGQGLECDLGAGVCVSLPIVGEPCERGACADGAWCDELDDDGPVCKAQVPPGAPCTVADACASSLCADGTCLDFVDASCFFVPPWEPY
jgi:hypothetical protein